MSHEINLAKIRRVLLRNRGEIGRLAKQLGVTPTTVSQVLKGRAVSQRIVEAAAARAAELEFGAIRPEN
jgi:DNA-binding transcriptional regulator YdaS (Cro superfamily)